MVGPFPFNFTYKSVLLVCSWLYCDSVNSSTTKPTFKYFYLFLFVSKRLLNGQQACVSKTFIILLKWVIEKEYKYSKTKSNPNILRKLCLKILFKYSIKIIPSLVIVIVKWHFEKTKLYLWKTYYLRNLSSCCTLKFERELIKIH